MISNSKISETFFCTFIERHLSILEYKPVNHSKTPNMSFRALKHRVDDIATFTHFTPNNEIAIQFLKKDCIPVAHGRGQTGMYSTSLKYRCCGCTHLGQQPCNATGSLKIRIARVDPVSSEYVDETTGYVCLVCLELSGVLNHPYQNVAPCGRAVAPRFVHNIHTDAFEVTVAHGDHIYIAGGSTSLITELNNKYATDLVKFSLGHMLCKDKLNEHMKDWEDKNIMQTRSWGKGRGSRHQTSELYYVIRAFFLDTWSIHVNSWNHTLAHIQLD